MDETATLDLAGRLLAEFDALRGLSPLATGVWLILVLAVSLALGWGGPAIVHLLWRLGIDRRTRLGLLSSGLRLLGLLVALLGLLRPLFDRAPTLGLLLVVVALAIAGLLVPTQLHNLASGLSLATRARLREGDLIRVGEIEGTVRDVGLLRVALRTSDGGVTHVPAGDFDRLAVTVGSRQAAIPINAKIVVDPSFGEPELELLRRALWMCVYRRAGTEVQIDHDARSGTLEVRMDTWASNAVVEAEAHLRALLLEHRGGSSTAPAPVEVDP